MNRNNRFSFKQPEFEPMPANKRGLVVPERGYCSILPAAAYRDALLSAACGKKMYIFGHPYDETVIFCHEKLYAKQYAENLQPPRIASILPEVRRLLREGKSKEANSLAMKASREDGFDERIHWHNGVEFPHSNYHGHPAFLMKLEMEKAPFTWDYLRTLDFTTGEATVRWSNDKGSWQHRSIVSDKENVYIQQILAPDGNECLDLAISIVINGIDSGLHPWERFRMPGGIQVNSEISDTMLAFNCRYDEEIMHGSGYAGVTHVIPDGGSVAIEDGRLVISGARSITLVSRVELFAQAEPGHLERLVQSLKDTEFDYDAMLAQNRMDIGEKLLRSSVNFHAAEERLLSTEELIALQHGSKDLCPTLIEKLYDIGRYFLITESGEFPPMVGQYNINVNLQVCSGNLTDLPESMQTFFRFVESKLPDFRTNAKNIFGCRGILGDIHSDIDNGLLYHFSSFSPHEYWVSCAGWIYNEFWGHFLVTGDVDFLREHVLPGLREVVLFFEDYLQDTDDQGNYIFYPSYSPENVPGGGGWSPVAINACMDIMVCREALDNLITAHHILGIEDPYIEKWQQMLDRLPIYLLDEEGALKEWAWKDIPEEYNHRHVSHHYDVWPGNGITWEDTPELARAVLLSNRKRARQDDSAHGIMHRLFTAIRLKDREESYFNLKQILEHGFINRNLMTNHYPYAVYFPDITGGFPAAVVEMLIYSNPGIMEFLPALPRFLPKGSLNGISSFAFARLNRLEWDMETGWIHAEISSLMDQEITIRYRYGIKSIQINDEPLNPLGSDTTILVKKGGTTNIVMTVQSIYPL